MTHRQRRRISSTIRACLWSGARRYRRHVVGKQTSYRRKQRLRGERTHVVLLSGMVPVSHAVMRYPAETVTNSEAAHMRQSRARGRQGRLRVRDRSDRNL